MFVDIQSGLVTNDGAHVLNGQGHGQVGGLLGEVNYEPGLLRPYLEYVGNGRSEPCVTIWTGKFVQNKTNGKWEREYKQFRCADLVSRGIPCPTWNATTMRKADWIRTDDAILRAARQPMRAWADLVAANSIRVNGMGKLTLEYEAMSDPGEAVVDMDAMTDGRTDSPLFKLRSIPLPITHSDFWFSERRLAVSRNDPGTALDTTMAEAGGRRIGELIERTTIGIETGITFGTQTTGYGTHDGNSTIYGYTNFPARNTYTTLTAPTGSNPEAVLANIIAMREALVSDGFFGPYMVYVSSAYDTYLDNDYFRSGSTATSRTLRDRLLALPDIAGIRRLNFLTSGFQIIMVQMTADVARAIIGMDLTVVQWPSQGGLRQNYKIMCIKVPQLRSDYNGASGIVHGTTS
jgi:hypothetical protein